MPTSITDRRTETRVSLRVPVKFRPVTTPPSGASLAESINLSQRGLCIATNVALKLGSRIEVFLTMPSEISGKQTAEVRCIARVVHVRAGWMTDKLAIGVRVERYETLSDSASERWAS